MQSVLKRRNMLKKNEKMASWMRNGALKVLMELNTVLKVIKSLKESFMLSRVKDVLTTEEDPSQLILQLMKRN